MDLAARESRWVQSPRHDFSPLTLQRALERSLPGLRPLEWHALGGGLRNSNFRVDAAGNRFVLRIYGHDKSICRKELDLHRMVSSTVPVPEVVHAEPDGFEELPPFAVMRFVEGITFLDLKRAGDREAIAAGAFAAGEALAAIGRNTFGKPGWIGPGPASSWPIVEGADPFPRFVDVCLESPVLQKRMAHELREHTSRTVWERSSDLAALASQTHLVHGDFSRSNLLLRQTGGGWKVAAVLDWEFAVSGAPLSDIANFLRYESEGDPICEPHFSAGFGPLPEGWRRLSRVLDLVALCDTLTREALPEDRASEVVELVRATTH